MTLRLYYDDPYVRDFNASVVRVEPRAARQAVWLDQSAFYPTSGGQPFDTGTIESLKVLDVIDEDDEVVHFVEGVEALHVGQGVRGAVNWARRFDHMQQHTGQHMLSAAVARLFHVPTVGFHLGAEASTIDLAREMTSADIAAAEDEANRVVWENRPVAIRYANAAEAAALGLRKASRREGTLRLIDIEDFDLSACGGSHVRQTGAVGAIVARSWERFKGGQRLEFVCGGRVVTGFRLLRDTVTASVQLLSVLSADLPTEIGRLQADVRDHKRSLVTLQHEVAAHRAEELAAAAEPHASAHLALRVVDGDANVLKALATTVVSRPGFVVVLVSAASPVLLVAARSQNVAQGCDRIVRALVQTFGGRGGGKPDLAQAGGLDAAPEAILAEARRLLVEPDHRREN